MTRITQSDIARLAGVHRTTVSLALRNHPSIPVPTRQRIQALAEKMAYRPDPGLCALMAYRDSAKLRKITATIGYVTNWTSRWGWRDVPAHGEFYLGAARRAEQLGYRLEHFWYGDYAACPARFATVLAARGIRGLILASSAIGTPPVGGVNWNEACVVKIDAAPAELPFDCVTNDQRRILQTMMRQTLALGYRRIGIVLPRRWDTCAELAWSAGLFAIQARLAPEDRVSALFYDTPATADSPAAMTVRPETLAPWLEAEQPDAIISYGPYLLSTLRALGHTVPGDVGFADVLLEARMEGPAGMRQNSPRVGEVAVERLARLLTHNIMGPPTVPVATLVEGTWTHGASLRARPGAFEWQNDTTIQC